MTTNTQENHELSSRIWNLLDETGDVGFTLKKLEKILVTIVDDNVQDDGLFIEMVLDYTKQAKQEVQELSQKIKDLHHTIDN